MRPAHFFMSIRSHCGCSCRLGPFRFLQKLLWPMFCLHLHANPYSPATYCLVKHYIASQFHADRTLSRLWRLVFVSSSSSATPGTLTYCWFTMHCNIYIGCGPVFEYAAVKSLCKKIERQKGVTTLDTGRQPVE